MWFRHRAWTPIAWVLCVANLVLVWFAARPGETWHATIHAVLAVACGLGAQHLARRGSAVLCTPIRRGSPGSVDCLP
jgi:hypothetical protein